MKARSALLSVALFAAGSGLAFAASIDAAARDIDPIRPPQLQSRDIDPIRPPQFQSRDIDPIRPPQFQSRDIDPIRPPQLNGVSRQ